MSERGIFIAIEGVDGAGKGTQSEALRQHLSETLGKNVLKISFPQYGTPSAVYAEAYLNGKYGQADDVPADLASLAFAIDRVAASPKIEQHLEEQGSITLADRYMASNLAHQGTKFSEADERHEFYARTLQTEYEVLHIPRPDINIVLLLPAALAQANVDKKGERGYTNLKRDIHEANASHLERARSNYEELCQLYPDEFTAIICADEAGEIRPIEEIQEEIRKLISEKTPLKL